jgi:hydrogenase expression/formation protein HypE
MLETVNPQSAIRNPQLDSPQSEGPQPDEFTLSCPIPISEYPHVLLAHGGGGTMTHKLIEKMFVPAFSNSLLESRHDGATFNVNGARLAFTTDSHVVHPLFFPGGDIGTLAVNGTVNDLAMCGARPLYLSVGFILEEGLPMETLWRVVQSMRQAAEEAGVQLVTGDTKVVDRGKGDGIFINTAGVGVIDHHLVIGPQSVRPGDAILLSGDIGRHGIAIMAVREGLDFSSDILSDCAPLNGMVAALLKAGVQAHCLRDLTRGGLASALVEIAEACRLHLGIDESAVPVGDTVQGACELLGLDPLHVANEGRFVAFVPQADAECALGIMRSHPLGAEAAIIGHVNEEPRGLVTMKSMIGASRIVDMLSGEQLPRIC